MERILKYIETHICDPMTNKQLAEIAGYSLMFWLVRFACGNARYE